MISSENEIVPATSVTGQAGPSRDAVSPVIINKLRCCKGLADLATKKYKKAALHFLQANAYSCDFPDVSSRRLSF